jgi:hypothetical protein
MTARILTIKERHLQTPGQLASLADFTCVDGDEVDPRVVLDNLNLSLYCFDDATRQAIFVELPSGVDLTKSPFVYKTQGEEAERLIAVSYDTFLRLAASCLRSRTSSYLHYRPQWLNPYQPYLQRTGYGNEPV